MLITTLFYSLNFIILIISEQYRCSRFYYSDTLRFISAYLIYLLNYYYVRSSNLLNIERLLLIAERYVVTVEEMYAPPRTIQPHGASFQGLQITLNITADSPKMDFQIQASCARKILAHIWKMSKRK